MVSFVTQSQLGEVVVGSQSQLTRSLVVFSRTGRRYRSLADSAVYSRDHSSK